MLAAASKNMGSDSTRCGCEPAPGQTAPEDSTELDRDDGNPLPEWIEVQVVQAVRVSCRARVSGAEKHAEPSAESAIASVVTIRIRAACWRWSDRWKRESAASAPLYAGSKQPGGTATRPWRPQEGNDEDMPRFHNVFLRGASGSIHPAAARERSCASLRPAVTGLPQAAIHRTVVVRFLPIPLGHLTRDKVQVRSFPQSRSQSGCRCQLRGGSRREACGQASGGEHRRRCSDSPPAFVTSDDGSTEHTGCPGWFPAMQPVLHVVAVKESRVVHPGKAQPRSRSIKARRMAGEYCGAAADVQCLPISACGHEPQSQATRRNVSAKRGCHPPGA